MYQGPDMGHRGGPHHHGDGEARKDEFTTANPGVISDSYSDPSRGVHKDNMTDAAYIPEYDVGRSLNNDSAPGYGTATSSGYTTAAPSGYTTPAPTDSYDNLPASNNSRYPNYM